MAKRDNSKEVFGKVKAALKELSDRPPQSLGKEAVSLIKDRTRDGFGVNTKGGVKHSLKALSKAYIERRKRSRLHADTSPAKSNLTFSGQLLNSLRSVVEGSQVLVYPQGNRRGKGPDNLAVAGYVEKAGRAFLNFSAKEIKALVKFYETTVLSKSLKAKGLTK